VRFYNLVITDPNIAAPANNVIATSTSFVNGSIDLGALDIEFDVPVFFAAAPVSAAYVKLYGVSIKTVSQAQDFNGKTLTLSAGMSAGLPLAKPLQQGVILNGTIQQAFGNWIGTEQYIEFIVVSTGSAFGAKPNYVFHWPKSGLLSDAIRQTLAQIAPGYNPIFNISPNLVLPAQEDNYCYNITDFAQYINAISKSILSGKTNYPGVNITVTGNKTILVDDASTVTTPKVLEFSDLLGQPVYTSPSSVQVTTVLRADINPTAYIQLPQNLLVTFSPSNGLVPANKSIFQGNFYVTQVRHVGHFRSADALGWLTTLDCSPQASLV